MAASTAPSVKSTHQNKHRSTVVYKYIYSYIAQTSRARRGIVIGTVFEHAGWENARYVRQLRLPQSATHGTVFRANRAATDAKMAEKKKEPKRLKRRPRGDRTQ